MEKHLRQEIAESLSLKAAWEDSAIHKNMERDLEETLPILDRYSADPCPETFALLQKVREVNSRNVAEIEKQCESLKQTVLSLTARIENRKQDIAAAQTAGDSEKVNKLKQQQTLSEQLLQSVEESSQQADDLMKDAYAAFARFEAFLKRERARFEPEGS